ncbi:MAG: hypothetical protein LBU79_07060 [Planctomycetota bacterium]|jgi:hypothetical protein|nr:hypothetical protein [Planctomycetota bacterium]
MSDLEKEIEACLQTSEKVLRESERLKLDFERGRASLEEVKKANNLTEEKQQRFFASLSPEDQRRVAEEEELFSQQLRHDMDLAVQNAGLATVPDAKRRGKRDYL